MHYTFLDLLILFGVVLGFFLAILLLFSKSFRSDIHKYFALTIIALNFCLIYTWFEEFVPANGVLELISWDFLFPFTFMVYTLKAIKHPLGESRRIWWFAIPWIVFSLIQFIDFFLDFDFYYWVVNGNEESLFILIELRSYLFLMYMLALVVFSYNKVRAAKNIQRKARKWLQLNRLYLLGFVVVWIIFTPLELLFDIQIWEYLLASLSIFLVILTYRGIHQLNISEQRDQIHKIVRDATTITLSAEDEKPLPSSEKSQRSVTKKTEEKLQRLSALMIDQQLYLNPNLTRSLVAEALDISEGYLSELLKTVLNTSFNDYVNDYRVRHVIKMFHDQQFHKFSLEAIGYESGFNTRSVFYNAFKKVTQKSPGVYLKE